MFCKSCGKQIDNDSNFCSFCGTKQSAELKPQFQVEINESSTRTHTVDSNATYINNSPQVIPQTKYDPTYKREEDAMTFGVILLVIAIIFAILGPIQFEDNEMYEQFYSITLIVSATLRVIITIWVLNIAERQNRETIGWGLFAFFLPSIALIVIASSKKIIKETKRKKSLEEAEFLKGQGRYEEAIQSILVGYQNKEISKVVACYNISCYYSLKMDYEKSKRFLLRAVRVGYHNLLFIEKDPDLLNLRRNSDFASFLKLLKSENGKVRNRIKADQSMTQALQAINVGDIKSAICLGVDAIYCNKINFIFYYNLACFYSLNKEIDMALNYLDQAIELGYFDLQNILRDDDLINLRNEPLFKEILTNRADCFDFK